MVAYTPSKIITFSLYYFLLIFLLNICMLSLVLQCLAWDLSTSSFLIIFHIIIIRQCVHFSFHIYPHRATTIEKRRENEYNVNVHTLEWAYFSRCFFTSTWYSKEKMKMSFYIKIITTAAKKRRRSKSHDRKLGFEAWFMRNLFFSFFSLMIKQMNAKANIHKNTWKIMSGFKKVFLEHHGKKL